MKHSCMLPAQLVIRRTILLLLVIITSVFSSAKKFSRDSWEIQREIDRARAGDTVFIAEGDYYLESTIVINKGITLLGAGMKKTSMRGENETSDFWLIKVDCLSGERVRISGISFYGFAPAVSPGIKLVRGCRDFRIDNCHFERCSRRAIEIHGDSRGVIDHCLFIDNWYTAVVVYGDGESGWRRPLHLGDSNAVYVEDNYFEQKDVAEMSMAHHIASNNGSRYVFRYNTIRDGNMASHAIDAHGNKYGWERGSRSYEIYHNRIFAIHRWAGINIRGGDGVIFNNEFNGDFVSPIHLMHESKAGDGTCNYPCIDQIRELHIWNNTYNGKPVSIRVRHPEIIQDNRDYTNGKRPGYTPYAYPHPLIR